MNTCRGFDRLRKSVLLQCLHSARMSSKMFWCIFWCQDGDQVRVSPALLMNLVWGMPMWWPARVRSREPWLELSVWLPYAVGEPAPSWQRRFHHSPHQFATCIDDAGQFECRGGDGLGCAEFAPHASEEVAEIGRAMMQCLGSEPQRQGGSALQFSCPGKGDFATRDLPVRAQR